MDLFICKALNSMDEQKIIIGCDWGTSSFRLRVTRIQDGKPLAESASSDGVSVVYQDWVNSPKEFSVAQTAWFVKFLAAKITDLVQSLKTSVCIEAVVVSGMASSTIGIVELPYATTIFPLSGQHVIYKKIEAGYANPYPVYIISGLRHKDEVMRGEETQLIGLAEMIKDLNSGVCTCILPGTHSKHIKIRKGNITAFSTCITGELFNLLRRHGVIGKSVAELSSTGMLSESAKSAFQDGVKTSIGNNLLNTIFRVRTNQLFNRLTKTENYYFLSGLLIGAELQDLVTEPGEQLILAAGDNITAFYQEAIRILKPQTDSRIMDPKEVEAAAMLGQLKLYNTNFQNAAYGN